MFELYGFAPLETPIIEKFDVLASKYAGGAEILKETLQSLKSALSDPPYNFIIHTAPFDKGDHEYYHWHIE
ncbi:MAG: hypothetical protein HZB87_12410, partial [Desulfatitalea sp.]|nr:hypothetical protein [Desulfatitalea sp.]